MSIVIAEIIEYNYSLCVVQLYADDPIHIMENDMEKQAFIKRLTELRMAKGVSARDMSLSLGQSPGYINNIENGVNLPSMAMFFYICDYLKITPKEFFDTDSLNPTKLNQLAALAKDLSSDKLDLVMNLVKEMKK